MVDRYLSVKFGVNPLGGFRENDVYGRTDVRVTRVVLCCAVTESRAKTSEHLKNYTLA